MVEGTATVGGIRRLEKTRGFLKRCCDALVAVAAPLIGAAGGESALTISVWISSVLVGFSGLAMLS